MVTVGAFAAKTHLAALLERVERGEEVLVTRHGKAVARLVPVATADRAEAAAHYRRFVALWADAHPALQPQVAARRRWLSESGVARDAKRSPLAGLRRLL